MKQLTRIDHENPAHSKTVVVNWCMGNTCNFACSYCPDVLHDGTIPWADYEHVIQFCEKVIEHYQRKQGNRLYFEFTGGEVSLYRPFLELVRYLHEKGIWVGMISNGSRALDWWEKARPYLDHVCVSYHSESSKPDHFKKVVRYLHETSTVHVNVMMLPSKFDECMEIARWVESDLTNVSIAIQPLLKGFGSEMYPYTEEQKGIMKNFDPKIRYDRPLKTYRGRMVKEFSDGSIELTTGPQLIAGQENNWAGWKCWAGVHEIIVDLKGDIFRAWCQEGGRIGNIRDGEIDFPEDPVTCTRSYCHCVLDVMNRREKIQRVGNADGN